MRSPIRDSRRMRKANNQLNVERKKMDDITTTRRLIEGLKQYTDSRIDAQTRKAVDDYFRKIGREIANTCLLLILSMFEIGCSISVAYTIFYLQTHHTEGSYIKIWMIFSSVVTFVVSIFILLILIDYLISSDETLNKK